jgi:hypothetical protein
MWERGGVNLYGFAFNSSTFVIDILGLDPTRSNGAPSNWPTPPTSIPGGPWIWHPDQNNSRGGTLRPANPPPKQSVPTLTWSPPTCNSSIGNPNGYWKLNDGKSGTFRYDPQGNPITAAQAHPGRPGNSTTTPTRPNNVNTNSVSNSVRAGAGAAAAILLISDIMSAFDPYVQQGQYSRGMLKAIEQCQKQKNNTPNHPGSCCGCCTITSYYLWQYPQSTSLWYDLGLQSAETGIMPPSGDQYFVRAFRMPLILCIKIPCHFS